jgi:mannan endo-1,4-beta-mannosidase
MSASFVGAAGTQFILDGNPFPAVGVNCYFLAYCSDASRRAAMLTARQMGAKVIRSWAFLDAAESQPGEVVFQCLENGVITSNDGASGLRRLDALIHAAEELDFKLILPLVNHWPDFGGMPMYLKWLGITGDVSQFYSSLDARHAYRSWLEKILTRRNTITGRRYCDEPSIMAWELTNEARCDGHRDLLLDWAGEMSSFVKQLDNHHLLALGDEGFIRQGVLRHHGGELYDGRHGTDFAAILDLPDIDFGGYHFYPQNWGYTSDLNFAEKWMQDHAAIGQRRGKPVIMEEYGLKLGDATVPDAAARNEWFGRWLASRPNALLWMLGGSEEDTKGYRDEYFVLNGEEVPAIVAHSSLSARGTG